VCHIEERLDKSPKFSSFFLFPFQSPSIFSHPTQLCPQEDGSPITEGKITFQSFLLFGSLPLVPVMIALLLPNSDSQQSFNAAIGFSILFTVVTLGILGYTKVCFPSKEPYVLTKELYTT